MLVSPDMRAQSSAPTSLPAMMPAGQTSHDFDVLLERLRHDLDVPYRSTLRSTRNLLVSITPEGQGRGDSHQVLPLRVALETYESGEYIARLVADRSFSGHGHSVEEAVQDLAELILHDLVFYSGTPEDQLTGDAKQKKAMLEGLFAWRP